MLPNPQSIVWDEWLILAVQLLGLVFLIIYVVKTWQMATATRAAAESSALAIKNDIDARMEALAPRMLIYFDDTSGLARIVIQNAGMGTAKDLRLEFEPPLQSTQPKDSLQFFTTTQAVVPPGFKHSQIFDSWSQYLASNLPRQYQVTARFCGAENLRNYEVHVVLDVESVRHRHIQRSATEIVVEEMKELRSTIKTALHEQSRELLPVLNLNTMAQGTPKDVRAAARDLIGTWKLMRVVEAAPEAYYTRETMLQLLRIQTLALFRKLPCSGATQERSEAIEAIAPIVFNLRAAYGRSPEWVEKLDVAMQRLEDAFGEDDVAGGPSVNGSLSEPIPGVERIADHEIAANTLDLGTSDTSDLDTFDTSILLVPPDPADEEA